mgnify:CR=1 FL=1
MIVEDKSKGEYFMNSGMIDYNSVIMIIKKIELYRDNEEKIIDNIKKSINTLSNYYYSDSNNKLLLNKINNLNNALDTMLNNRTSYIEYLTRIVNVYIDTNKENINIYNNIDIN